jgi:NAD+ diphosphatase
MAKLSSPYTFFGHHRSYGIKANQIKMTTESQGNDSSFRIADRAEEVRRDQGRLEQLLNNRGGFIVMWRGLNLFTAKRGGSPLLRSRTDIVDVSSAIFLGLRLDGTGLFAINLNGPDSEEAALSAVGLAPARGRFVHLREFEGSLSPDQRDLLLYARALLYWHDQEKFCGRCGAPTVSEEAGHVRGCTKCGLKHFPRSDPATIMLVHRDGYCLLGRQPSWPENIYSTLAGFVEAGESAEEAVAREVKEESGIEIRNLRYFGSQPWPFPQSLMLGYFAEAATTEIVRGHELADVRWFNVEETRQLLERLSGRFPHLNTIARRLIRAWLVSQS